MVPVHRYPGATVVALHEAPLGSEERERLRTQLLHLVRDGERLVLDCSRVRVFSASLIGLLLSLRRQGSPRRDRIVLCDLPPYAEEVLRVSRLERFWPVYQTAEEALDPEPTPIIVQGADGRTEQQLSVASCQLSES